MKTRRRAHTGFGTALEALSTSGRWYHVKWLAGPVAAYQKMLRESIARKEDARDG